MGDTDIQNIAVHNEVCNNRNIYKRESHRGKVHLCWISERGRTAREDFPEKLEFNQGLEGCIQSSRSKFLERTAWEILGNTWLQSNMKEQAMKKGCCGIRGRRAGRVSRRFEYLEVWSFILQITRKQRLLAGVGRRSRD